MFGTETRIVQGTLPRWAAGWEVDVEPALQATWPVGNASHHRLRGSPLSAWVGTHMSGAGLGDQVARNIWLRNVPKAGIQGA